MPDRNPPHSTAMHGCFINLQASTARRAAMEAQLHSLGMAKAEAAGSGVGRFDAIGLEALPPAAFAADAPLSPRERACFLSHLGAIESAPADAFFLVLEDDAQLSRAAPALLHDAAALARLADCDIVFLECLPYTSAPALLALWRSLKKHLPHDANAPREAIGGVEILPARGLYNWGAVAYLVTPAGQRTLPALLREALAAGPAHAFDMTLNDLVASGRVRGAVLAPFLATPAPGSEATSTIDDRARVAGYDALGGALRRMFFAGPIDGIDDHVAAYRHAPLTDDPQLQLLADVMSQLFVITARG